MSPPHGRLVGSAILITTSTYITYGLGLFVGAIVARSLGPELYGGYAYLVWFTGWLVVVANHGLTTTAIRFVSEFRGRGTEAEARKAHGYLNRMHWASIGLVVLSLAGASLLFPDAEWSVGGPMILLAAAACVVSRAKYLFDISVAKGYGIFRIEAYSMMLVGLVTAVAVTVLWWFNASLGAFIAMYAASSVAMYLMAALQIRSAQVRPEYGPLQGDDRRDVHKHLAWTALLIGAVVFGNRAIETFVLNTYWDSAQLGFFTLAGNLARGSTELLTVGLSTILMPTMAQAFGAGGRERVHDIFRKAMRYFVFLGALLAGASCFIAPPAILLLYGSNYEPVAFNLQVMQIAGGLTVSQAAIGSLLATTGQQSTWAKVMLLPAGISAISAPLLVPDYGVAGALISSTVAQMVGFVVLGAVAVRSQSIRLPWRSFGGIAVSGVLAALLALGTQAILPGTVGQVVAAVVFVAGLVTLSFPLGAWQRTDAALIEGLIARFPGSGTILRPVERYMRRLP